MFHSLRLFQPRQMQLPIELSSSHLSDMFVCLLVCECADVKVWPGGLRAVLGASFWLQRLIFLHLLAFADSLGHKLLDSD